MLSLSAAFCAALGNQHTHSPPASLIATRTFVKPCSLIDHSVVPSTSSFQPNVAHMVFVAISLSAMVSYYTDPRCPMHCADSDMPVEHTLSRWWAAERWPRGLLGGGWYSFCGLVVWCQMFFSIGYRHLTPIVIGHHFVKPLNGCPGCAMSVYREGDADPGQDVTVV